MQVQKTIKFKVGELRKGKQELIDLALTNSINGKFKKGNIPWNKGLHIKPNHSKGFKKGGTAWNIGLTKEEDARMMNLSIALKGHKVTEEAKDKMKKNHKGMLGKIFSEEHKRKIRENAKINFNYGMKGKKHKKETIQKIRESRANQVFPMQDTTIEIKIQNFLKLLHIEFATHYYTKEISHAYQCDILIPLTKTIIECDGDYWHGNPEKFPNLNELQKSQVEEDKIRTKELQEKGYRVIRLWEEEIDNLQLDEFEKRITEPQAMNIGRTKKSITNGGCFSSQA